MALRVLILILCLSVTVNAATYYCKSSGGSDGNAGTSWGAAWATIDKVNSTLAAGDTVYLYGTWYNQYINCIGGTSGSDRTAYIAGNGTDNTINPGGAIIHSARLTTGSDWTLLSGNVYYLYPASLTGPSSNAFAAVWNKTDHSYPTEPCYDETYTSACVNEYNESVYNGDTVFYWAPDSTAPGVNDTLYVSYSVGAYLNGGSDDYVSIVGIDFRHNSTGVYIDQTTPQPDSVFVEYCLFDTTYGHNGNNTAMVKSGSPLSLTISDQARWYFIRGCTFGDVWAMENRTCRNSGSAVEVYSMWHGQIDSCTVQGDYYPGAIFYFKGRASLPNPDQVMHGNVICYNTIKTKGARSVYANGINCDSTLFFGNVIDVDSLYVAFEYFGCDVSQDGGCDSTYGTRIYNNTFYLPDATTGKTGCTNQGDENLHVSGGGGSNWRVGTGNEYKYNVFCHNLDADNKYFAFSNQDTTTGTVYWTIDSNLYYSQSGTPRWYVVAAGNIDSTTWKSRFGWDANSETHLDPGFTGDTANSVFTRGGASGEMSRAYTDNRGNNYTHTIFGAVENAAASTARLFKGWKR